MLLWNLFFLKIKKNKETARKKLGIIEQREFSAKCSWQAYNSIKEFNSLCKFVTNVKLELAG